MNFGLPTLSVVSDLRLDHIRESLLRPAEIPDTEPEEDDDSCHRESEARQVNSRQAATNGPTEPIDDSNDGIKGIEQAPFVRDNIAAESDRRNKESEL